jgi:hypothetical protein
MSPTDTPENRWLRIEANGQLVFSGTAAQFPPGNNEIFSITTHFPLAKSATVTISTGHENIFGPTVNMEYYSLRLSREP